MSVRLHSRYFPSDYGVGFAVDVGAIGLRAELRDIKVSVWDDEWVPDFFD